MDLSKIYYFLRAAELQNFTKAAQSCNIAQTTMSKYITVLEQEVGCQLFSRSHKTAVLTPQGKKFYEGMRNIAQQYQALCCEISRDESRELRIGMITTDYADFPILRSFQESFPEVSIFFSFSVEGRLLEDLHQRRLDALICPNVWTLNDGIQEEIERLDLFTMEVSLVCSRELLSRCGSIEKVIAACPMITKTADSRYQALCREHLLRQYGQAFSDAITVSGFPQQLLMLNLSKGFSIAPSVSGGEYESLVLFPAPEALHETVQLLYRRDYVSGSLHKLIEHIHEKKC